MLKRFLEFCSAEKIFTAKKIVVAVSGGADSLALADLLNRVKQKFRLKLCIAHYEHGLRGQTSLDDAKFVEGFARSLGIKFFCESGDVKGFAAENKLSIETAARQLRYEFLSKVCAEMQFDAIALAHHANDQAETILMRIMRGSTQAGLSAMRFCTLSEDYGLLIRPLLRFKKSVLESYCASRNITPRVDATNFQADTTRNKIRLELLPMLEKFNPAIVETLCRLGEVAAEESDFMNCEVEKIFSAVVQDNAILQDKFLKLHPALQRLVVKKFLGDVKDFGFVHFEEVRKVLTDNLSGAELPHKLRVNLRRGRLTAVKNFL